MLCMNRVVLPVSPGTCTLDTVIVPVPSFLLFVAVGLVIYLRPVLKGDSDDFIRIPPVQWLHGMYMFCVLAGCGMSILEITRLALAERGVGLLPITSIAMVFIFGLLWHERKKRTRAICFTLLFYWPILVAFEALKVSRLAILDTLFPAKHSAFPTSDQVIDNSVMTGLFALACLFEASYAVHAAFHQRSKEKESERHFL